MLVLFLIQKSLKILLNLKIVSVGHFTSVHSILIDESLKYYSTCEKFQLTILGTWSL